MIRAIKSEDYSRICEIVNDNWREIYNGYVNPDLLSAEGCRQYGCLTFERFDSLFWGSFKARIKKR